MNKQQRNYAIAKAFAEAADKQQMENEKTFLIKSGVKNPDGFIPRAIWQIEDETDFLRLSEEWDNSPLNQINEVKKAAAVLERAEDALIDYALSIIPPGAAETLNKHRRDYATRRKLLDLTFRLDTRTIQ